LLRDAPNGVVNIVKVKSVLRRNRLRLIILTRKAKAAKMTLKTLPIPVRGATEPNQINGYKAANQAFERFFALALN
jgi:hypothetical protein